MMIPPGPSLRRLLGVLLLSASSSCNSATRRDETGIRYSLWRTMDGSAEGDSAAESGSRSSKGSTPSPGDRAGLDEEADRLLRKRRLGQRERVLMARQMAEAHRVLSRESLDAAARHLREGRLEGARAALEEARAHTGDTHATRQLALDIEEVELAFRHRDAGLADFGRSFTEHRALLEGHVLATQLALDRGDPRAARLHVQLGMEAVQAREASVQRRQRIESLARDVRRARRDLLESWDAGRLPAVGDRLLEMATSLEEIPPGPTPAEDFADRLGLEADEFERVVRSASAGDFEAARRLIEDKVAAPAARREMLQRLAEMESQLGGRR